MPRTSTQTSAGSSEKSTTAAESVFLPTSGTAAESLRFFPRPRNRHPQHRVQSSASKTAKLEAHSPEPRPAPAGSCRQSPKASTPPGKSQSHPAAEAETSPETAQTHG